MGTEGSKIVDLDLNDLIEKLNKALADEWLAYYQYWIGSKVVKGPASEAAIAELIEHADEEKKHADMLIDRILQLDGTPIINFEDLHKKSTCGYLPPSDYDVKKILNQNIEGERCAIKVYNDLVKLTKDKDPITHSIVLEILKDEIEHEDDLEKLLEDIS